MNKVTLFIKTSLLQMFPWAVKNCQVPDQTATLAYAESTHTSTQHQTERIVYNNEQTILFFLLDKNIPVKIKNKNIFCCKTLNAWISRNSTQRNSGAATSQLSLCTWVHRMPWTNIYTYNSAMYKRPNRKFKHLCFSYAKGNIKNESCFQSITST